MFSVSRKLLKQVKNITRCTSKSGPILCRSIYCCIFWGLAMTFNDAFASVKLCNVLEFIDGNGSVRKKIKSYVKMFCMTTVAISIPLNSVFN